MSLLDANFSVVEERNCPMYDQGDFFALSGLSLSTPEGKPSCILLVRKMAEILLPLREKTKTREETVLQNEYNCPGCTGLIKFSPATKNKAAFTTPHMQMMLTAEQRNQALNATSMHEILATFPLFKGIGKEYLLKISERLQKKIFSPNQHIIFRGRPGKYIYIIMSGGVDILSEDGGTLTSLHQGEIFGEMSLFSGKPISATIRANGKVQALLLSGKDFSNILMKYPFLQMIFTRMLVRRLSSANAAKENTHEAGVTGNLDEVSLAELFQMFNTNSRTGMFTMQLPLGPGIVTFVEGEIVRAEYNSIQGPEAFWAILKEQQGSFKFTSFISIEEMAGEILGSFIGLLMEGMRRLDEASATPEQLAEK